MKLLLQARADIDQKANDMKPLRAVAGLIKDFYLLLKQGKQWLKF